MSLLLVLLAGCAQPATQEPAGPVATDDGVTTLTVQVVDSATQEPVEDASVQLAMPGVGSISKETDREGRASFHVAPAGPCSILLEKEGYRAGAVALDCGEDRSLRILLQEAVDAGDWAEDWTPPATGGDVPEPDPGEVPLQGTVVDPLGLPLPGVRVQVDPPDGDSALTDAAGSFLLFVRPGPHAVHVEAPCWGPASFGVEVAGGGFALDVQLTGDEEPPAMPSGLRATGGPGPGMVAIAWDPVPGAAGYVLLRGDPPLPLVTLGNSLAYGVHGAAATHAFWVAARDSCGLSSAAAGPVSAQPLPSSPASPWSASVQSFTAEVTEQSYPVFGPDGQPVRIGAWRTVEGTGNCCENYLTTTADGRILDIGAETFYVSGDQGQSWSRIVPDVPPLCGEGAGVAAPDGDVVGIDWIACLPIMDDQLLALKYSKATDEWLWQSMPLHLPFYDRPWIGVVKGPFEVEGMIVPYLTFAVGAWPSKEVLLVSLDGLHYFQPSSSFADAVSNSVSLPALDLEPDVDRDWIQATRNSGLTPLDHGLGLRGALDLLGGNALLQDGLTWGSAELSEGTLPDDPIVADSAGSLHSIAVEEGGFTYLWSHDGGRSWGSLFQAVDGGAVADWDFRAHAALDQTVVALKVQKGDGDDAFRLYRFTGLSGTPALKEVLQVGLGDHPFRGAVTGGGSRFDFMTVALLPTGKAVLSFGDSQHNPPAIAIEL